MKTAAATAALVIGLGSVALAHNPFPEMKQKIETRLQRELTKLQHNAGRARERLEKRSNGLEKRFGKEAGRIEKLQASIAGLEQKIAAAKTPEEKELLSLRLEVDKARLDLAQKETAYEKRALELAKDRLAKIGEDEAKREQGARDRAAKVLQKAQERAQAHVAKEAQEDKPAPDQPPVGQEQ